MSFVGKLDEFELADLLQILAANQKSGKLNLTRRDTQGLIVFSRGRIIYATTSSARETLGYLLISEDLISEQDLLSALELQHRARQDKRLGTILVEEGLLAQKDLQRIIKAQIEKVVAQVMEWKTGFFRFEPLDIPDQGEVAVDAQDFLLHDGLHTEQVLADLEATLESATVAAGETLEPSEGKLTSLKSIMSEIRSPEFTGEATGRILDFARQVFSRGILFTLRQGIFSSTSYFGIDTGETVDHVPAWRLRIPVDQPSILSHAAETQISRRGPLEPTEGNLHLVNQLGGPTPTEAAALPLVVNGEVLLVLYGDNAPTNTPLDSLEALDLLLNQAGLAMEKRLLEKRIERLS